MLGASSMTEKLAWNLREAAGACGVSVALLRKEIDAGRLSALRAGRRLLIADAELRRWLGLSQAQIEAGEEFKNAALWGTVAGSSFVPSRGKCA